MPKLGVSPLEYKKLNWFSSPEPGHLVQFYKSDEDLLLPLVEFIAEGLNNGDTCFIIATPSHRHRLNKQLEERGFDIDHVKQNGQCMMLDADVTLNGFMVDGLPDKERFLDTVGALINAAVHKGRPIRAYGEMVALLWKEGNKDAVIQLEELWNALAKKYIFSLFCAYPELQFIMDADDQEEISSCHNLHFQNLART